MIPSPAHQDTAGRNRDGPNLKTPAIESSFTDALTQKHYYKVRGLFYLCL